MQKQGLDALDAALDTLRMCRVSTSEVSEPISTRSMFSLRWMDTSMDWVIELHEEGTSTRFSAKDLGRIDSAAARPSF